MLFKCSFQFEVFIKSFISQEKHLNRVLNNIHLEENMENCQLSSFVLSELERSRELKFVSSETMEAFQQLF